MTNEIKMMCSNLKCTWYGGDKDFLTATNPFDSSETITGCPKCKGIDTIRLACEEPDCWLETTCGTPTKDGYMRTCGKHMPTVETVEK